MHKGRQYRQVLPHNLTPDMIGFSAPVRLIAHFQFTYFNDFVDAFSDPTPVLTVDLPTLSIQWRGELVFGSFRFGFLIQQRIFEHEPGLFYRFVVVDNTGEMLQAETRWQLPTPGWAQDEAGEFFFGEQLSIVVTPAFGTLFGPGAFVVHYHDEPP
jgi:hypothetical protein